MASKYSTRLYVGAIILFIYETAIYYVSKRGKTPLFDGYKVFSNIRVFRSVSRSDAFISAVDEGQASRSLFLEFKLRQAASRSNRRDKGLSIILVFVIFDLEILVVSKDRASDDPLMRRLDSFFRGTA